MEIYIFLKITTEDKYPNSQRQTLQNHIQSEILTKNSKKRTSLTLSRLSVSRFFTYFYSASSNNLNDRKHISHTHSSQIMKRRALLTGSLIFFFFFLLTDDSSELDFSPTRETKLQVGTWLDAWGDNWWSIFPAFAVSLADQRQWLILAPIFSRSDEDIPLPKGLCSPTMRQCRPCLSAPGCSLRGKRFLLCESMFFPPLAIKHKIKPSFPLQTLCRGVCSHLFRSQTSLACS